MTEHEDPLAFARGCLNALVITIVGFFVALAILFLLARYGLWPTP